MSYWSLRRVADRTADRTADRAASGRALGGVDDESPAPARTRLPDWTPVAERHLVRVSSPGRTLRQRAADLEAALWSLPTADQADLAAYDQGVSWQVRSRW